MALVAKGMNDVLNAQGYTQAAWWNRIPVAAWGLMLVMGGALGNVIDRVRFGAVVDFIQWHVAGYYWPAFNVADSAITLGAVLLDRSARPMGLTPAGEMFRRHAQVILNAEAAARADLAVSDLAGLTADASTVTSVFHVPV